MEAGGSLPPRGRVLGIDVGYSRRARTTGLCLLWWDADRVDWGFEVVGSDEAERARALVRLTRASPGPVEAVALDGPLRPGLACQVSYRSAEAVLSRGRFQRRGKPGPTNAGSGPALHRAATDLAKLALRELEVRDARHPASLCREAVVEAFPNLFLGVLCDEAAYPDGRSVRRRWTDALYPLVKNRLLALARDLLPGRRSAGERHLSHHEQIAAWACALTALCVAARDFEAVGAPDDGFIALPPQRFWGRAAGGGDAWAHAEIGRTLASARARFPAAARWRMPA